MDGLRLDATLPESLARRFDERHHVRYGHEMPSGRETVTFRLRAFGEMQKLEMSQIEFGSDDASAALKEHRSVHIAGSRQGTGVYDRAELRAGNVIAGPAIVEEPAHVTVIYPGDSLRVDAYGNLVVTIGG
jgi:N-methylhydantoinase A